MAISFPYARYVCPCSDDNAALHVSARQDDSSSEAADEHLFNPHDLRANYLLYPIDQLLFCDECNQMRCPKCCTEEMIYWYCPNCLFDVPSSGVKSDGNRCSRHCYDCPICTSPLAVIAVNRPSEGLLKPSDAAASESYVLHCQYCDWTTLDIGLRFNKPNKITEQLNKLWKERTMPAKPKDGEHGESTGSEPSLNHESAFANLSKFYKEQLNDSTDQQNIFSSSPYSSPTNLARIMSLYGGLSYNALKKTQEKPQPMREALNAAEGLSTYTADHDPSESDILHQLQTLGLEGTSTAAQRLSAPSNYSAKFVSQLWPVATKLRVRKGKRCRTCRQFLARPEPKVGSMRYKIRLLAVNYVQRLSLRPINALGPIQSSSFHLRPEPVPETILQPNKPLQYILTVRNPIFEPVRVTLATPSITPGKIPSRVTILCPSFTVGPAGDVWDEALATTTPSLHSNDGGRQAAMASLTGAAALPSSDADRQPEAGKIWDRSRNTTSVILEIVPASVDALKAVARPRSPDEDSHDFPAPDIPALFAEDDDVLEIPIFVRAEWEADPHDADPMAATTPTASAGTTTPRADPKRPRESKELAYWCVLGVGRIASTLP